MASMEYEIKGVTLSWLIENNKCTSKLYSPVFSVDIMNGTKWKLGMKGAGIAVYLYIEREAEDDGPEVFGLHYEFTVTVFDGIPNSNWTIENYPTRMNSYKFRKSDWRSEFIYANFVYILRQNPIVIRCNIFAQQGSISEYVYFFARTEMRIENYIFCGVIENFSRFDMNERKRLKMVSSTKDELMTVDLGLPHDYDPKRKDDMILQITINLTVKQDGRYYYFKAFILDSRYEKTEVGKLETVFFGSGIRAFILPKVSKMYLIENASLYLPNDTLSLRFEIGFCSGIEYENILGIEYDVHSITDVKQTNFSSGLDSLLSKEENICDVKLQTATEIFSAHTAILSAKSPVFDAMFKSNMLESIQKCVHIEDVDAETMKCLLVYLYSETLEKMEWKDAMKLYIAADKYQILSLKEECGRILRLSIDFSNCCVLLQLADMHQDEDLKTKVQQYLAGDGLGALDSVQWRNLERNHPQLATETRNKTR